jgi:hypothetical protein
MKSSQDPNDQITKLKKQLADCKSKLTEATTNLDALRAELNRLKAYHEGPDLSQNPIRYAEARALQQLEKERPALTRALAVYVHEDSYEKLQKALPGMAYGYAGGTPETAYNRLLGMIHDELSALHAAVRHRHTGKTN